MVHILMHRDQTEWGQVLHFAFHSKKFKLGLFYWYRV
jgi:hypothetical protein